MKATLITVYWAEDASHYSSIVEGTMTEEEKQNMADVQNAIHPFDPDDYTFDVNHIYFVEIEVQPKGTEMTSIPMINTYGTDDLLVCKSLTLRGI